MRRGRWLWFLVGCLALFGGTGCGVFDVELQETFDISVDVNDLLSRSKINPKTQFPTGRIPAQFKAEIPFWFSKNYDLRENPKVKQYQSKIVGIRVDQVSYEVLENSVNVALPNAGRSFSVLLAAHGSTKVGAFTRVGFVGSIPAGKSDFGAPMIFAPDGRVKLQPFVDALAFSLGVSGTLRVDGAVNPLVPTGRLKLRVKLDVTVSLQLYLTDLPEASKAQQSAGKVQTSPTTSSTGTTPTAM